MTELNNVAYANITVLQNFTNGPVAFNITAYDGSGNEFNVTQNDTSANVIIDTVDPKSSNLTIYSNNSRTDYAMAGHLLMFALAVVPFTIIIDVMPNTVTFAVFRASFAVIVMFSR